MNSIEEKIIHPVAEFRKKVIRVEVETRQQALARLAIEEEAIGQRRVKAIKSKDLDEIYQTSSDYLAVEDRKMRGEPLQRSLVLFDSKRLPFPPTEPERP